tara:strand:- start:89352 stop:90332 length:981 start_codon:yes stop_codon:yes gene_type:complete
LNTLLPWANSAEFRAKLPEMSAVDFFTQPTSSESQIAAYREFYSLQTQDDIQHFMGRFESDHFELVGQVYKPANPKGTLFIYHGYFDHFGLFSFPVQLGLKLGFTVVGFDLPGHGLSSGPLASIDCFSRYAEAQKRFIELLPEHVCPRPWCALGQSTGGAVILDTGVPHYDGVILMAPLVRVYNWHWTRLMYQALRHRGGIERTFSENTSDKAFSVFLNEKDPLQHRRIEAPWVGAMIEYTKRVLKMKPSSLSPLVFQGDLDKTVDAIFNMKHLRKIFNKPDIVMLQGAKHHLANESQHYKRIMKDKITSYLMVLEENQEHSKASA